MLLLPNQLNEIQSISAALTESFQTTFDWWICDGGEWQPLHWDSDASAFPNRPHAGEIEFSAGDNDEAFWRQPQVVAQSPNQHLLIFPIRHNDLPPTAACAVFATAEPHWQGLTACAGAPPPGVAPGICTGPTNRHMVAI